ncbi:hypothetical protein BH10PSE15_BH10PSE15_04800 [soil metagenome]
MKAIKSFAPVRPATRISARGLGRFACLTLGCFGFILLGFALNRFTALPPIMPMTGIAMAGMLLWGKRMWPAVPLSVLLALLVAPMPGPIPLQIVVALSLTIGPIAGVLVIERLIGKLELPAKAEHALPIILGAATCSVLMAACVAVPMALHGDSRVPLGLDLFDRAIRRLTSALLTLPLVLAWADSRPEPWSYRRGLYFATILLVTAGVAYVVFFVDLGGAPVAWIVYTPLIWAALAFRMRGITAAMLLISVAAFAGNSMGLGVFTRMHGDPQPMMLLFVAVTDATMLMFAAFAHERVSERRLHAEVSQARFALEIARAEAVDANTRLRLSQEAAGAVAWEYDVESARLVRAFGESEAFDIMTGQHPVAGMAPEIGRDDLEMVTAAMRDAVSTGGRIDVSLRAGRPDGPARWLRVVGRYDGSNNRRRLVGMTLDVTLLHEAQEAARAANDKLLGISRLSAMGAMASTLAHELNQPLTAIANYASTARMLLTSSIPDGKEMAVEHLTQLADASLRAGRLIRTMRDFTISGEITHTVEDLADIVRAAWSNVRERPVAAGVAFAFESQTPGPMVAVDRLQIEQVLINLLLNAVEATLGREARQVHVEITAGRAAVRTSVRDNGRGLPDGMIDNLFEPFRTTKIDGTGLGLPICRTIVEAHRGKLWGHSRPEGGAEFVFTIAAVRMP